MSVVATKFHCLEPPELEAFLERRRATPAFGRDMSLAENLSAILRKANEFVPSEAGPLAPLAVHHVRQVDR